MTDQPPASNHASDHEAAEPRRSSSAPPQLRSAISRALSRRKAELQSQTSPEQMPSDPAVEPSDVAEPIAPNPMRQERYRVAASRAISRQRPSSEAQQPANSPTSRGRDRTRTRLRPPTLPNQPLPKLPAEQPVRRELPPAVVAALQPESLPAPEIQRPPLWVAFVAGLGWTAMLVWIFFGGLSPQSGLWVRTLFGMASLGLGLTTWLPIQWALRLPALTWRGTVGWAIIFWVLAFVPAPTTTIAAGLPDLPIYLLFLSGVFLASNALVLPLVYVWGIRRYHNRAQRFDVRRSHRQAAEAGIFCSLCVLLAAMNIFEPVTVLLLIAILVLSEMVILSLQAK
ncbi:hypothetical protein [Herpetosiphon geysericola]|uniref:Uncharacterized protein n=1 Tax=Herpetosiphon geysericola TaxID=70996 RepID=A0A0P6YB95_9CHLR|nr:hypothetical protein [Herpetosiphon geysericola]KPL86680.1 hypothetical protein SE18_11870 [Herpetosiphon geysericola]